MCMYPKILIFESLESIVRTYGVFEKFVFLYLNEEYVKPSKSTTKVIIQYLESRPAEERSLQNISHCALGMYVLVAGILV